MILTKYVKKIVSVFNFVFVFKSINPDQRTPVLPDRASALYSFFDLLL